ncbi:MAG TPA: 3-oxoacyl-ACP reductase family protein [Burkholderiales bacterium]|nr:3-oxoacyl-ACP reductase family protein [Burkholderiales bacterium]
MTEPGMHKGDEFAGKVALVTGAARNIGRAIALSLAAGGANVAVNTRSNIGEARGVVAEIKALGADADAFLADVAEPAQVQKMVDEVLKRFGRLDILVLNAAVREHVHVDEISFEDWRRVLSTNLDSAFVFTKACLPALKKAGDGRIVLFAGVTALLGLKDRVHVAASKHGIVGMTKALAADLAEFGIRVNCISPGQIDTSRAPGHAVSDRSKQIPLGRKGTPFEIAGMVRSLAGPAGAYMTGQTLHINGGLSNSGV